MANARVKGILTQWEIRSYAFYCEVGYLGEFMACMAELDDLARQAGVRRHGMFGFEDL